MRFLNNTQKGNFALSVKNQEKLKKEYLKKFNESQKLLKEIKLKLKKHKEEFNLNSNNWGYLGDLEHWVELMYDIKGTFKG